MRLFFAVLVPEDIRRDLARACGKLPASWRPVQESQMHLTLVFMGDVSVDGLERVVEVGDWAAASFDAFQVSAQ